MKIKVASSYSGKISTGSYENASPAFFAEMETVLNKEQILKEGFDPENIISTLQTKLQSICYGNFKAAEQRAIVERIAKERRDFRFYAGLEGKQYPSITSIINYDADFGIPDYQLQQYASQGQITHARVSHFIKTGKWVKPGTLEECHNDIVIVTKGDLGLSADSGNFEAFLKKFPIKEMKNGVAVFNHKEEYAGTYDFEGIPDISKGDWESIEGVKEVPTMFDIKRTVFEEKVFMQTAGYASCEGMSHIGQLCAIPLNNKTKQGFSKPVVSDRLDYYRSMLSVKRKAFKQRYAI